MKQSQLRSILAAAVAAVVFSGSAWAQVRVGEDGRALDANNQAGTGGYNSGRIPANPTLNGNRLITGNVTGPGYFRGNVPYRDPNEFRGGIQDNGFTRFLANSSGPPAAYSPPPAPVTAQNGQVFYNDRLLGSPNSAFNSGLQRQGFTGAVESRTIDNRLNQDMRIDARMSEIRPGESLLLGPMDPSTNQPTVLSASPLLGVKQLQLTDRDFLTSFGGLRGGDLDRALMDPKTVQRMREELEGGARPGAVRQDNNLTNPDDKNAKPIPGQINSQVRRPFDAPQNNTLAQPLQNPQINGALNNQVRPEGGIEERLTIAPPAVQSQKYAELEKRLAGYYSNRMQTDQDRYREFLQQLKARDAANKEAAAGTTPDYRRMARELVLQSRRAAATGEAPAGKPQPVLVKSIVEGVKAPGLSNLLRKAEDLMKEGKYSSAIDQYQAALQVAPNNGMLLVGQANAELAAGYYSRAEEHLRAALSSDPVLLVARFDVRSMLGDERLGTVVKELKETARTHQNDPGLALLLAYLAYGAGNDEQAGVYLDLADKRAGGKDDLIHALRGHWQVPDTRADAKPVALADLMREVKAGNLIGGTVTANSFSGEFKNPVTIPGSKDPVKAFKVDLPPGAAGGPFGKWLRENAKDADIRFDLPTAPSGK